MLIPLNFKTPDVISTAVDNLCLTSDEIKEFDEDNEDGTDEYAKENLKVMIGEHIEYDECLTVYYNTETKQLEL